MVTIRRRNPISSRTDVAPSSGLGEVITKVGTSVADTFQRRKEEKQGAQAIEDYMILKKQYQENVTADYTERLQNEDVDGYSDYTFDTGQRLKSEAIFNSGKKDNSPYAKTMSRLFDKDISSMTSKAIDLEESTRLEIGIRRHDRVSEEHTRTMPTEEVMSHLSGELSEDPISDMSLDANGLAKNEQSELVRKQALKNELRDRVLNADLEDEDYFKDLLAQAKENKVFGTDYKDLEMKFTRNMEFLRAGLNKGLADQNSQFLRAKRNQLIESFSKIDKGTPQKDVTAIKFQSSRVIKSIMEDESFDNVTKQYLVGEIEKMRDQAVSGELRPLEQQFESQLFNVKARVSEVNRNRPKTTGDEKADSDTIADYLDERIGVYSELSDMAAHMESLNVPQEDRDFILQELANTENEISTMLHGSEKSYLFRFWKADIDKNDPNRLSTHYEKFDKSMASGVYAFLDPVQQSQLRNHVLKGFIDFQRQRVNERMNGQQVKDFDVMDNAEQAQGFVGALAREGLFDILGEDAKKMQDGIDRAQAFVNGSKAEFDRDDSPNKTNFIRAGVDSGLSITGAMGLAHTYKRGEEQAIEDEIDRESEFLVPQTNESVNTLTEILERNGIAISDSDRDPIAAEKLYSSIGEFVGWLNDRLVTSPREKELTDPLYKFSPEATRQRREQGRFEEEFSDLKVGVSTPDPATPPQEFPLPEEQEKLGMATGTNMGDMIMDPGGKVEINEVNRAKVDAGLATIAKGESFGGFVDAMNQGTKNKKIVGSAKDSSSVIGKKLSSMTIGEIMTHQSKKQGNKDRVFAAGKYQIIPSTMKWAVKEMGLDDSQVFDETTQDAIGEYILANKQPSVRDYVRGESDDMDKAILGLAKEWASFPHPETGNSYYGKGNRASHTVQESKEILMALREAYTSANDV